jgi:hypothetical protein
VSLRISPAEKIWIDRKWAAIRESQQKADDANNDWKRINSAINEYLDRSGVEDIVQRAKIKSASIPLKDALAMGSWHSRNAERHIHDVNLFLRLRELEIR